MFAHGVLTSSLGNTLISLARDILSENVASIAGAVGVAFKMKIVIAAEARSIERVESVFDQDEVDGMADDAARDSSASAAKTKFSPWLRLARMFTDGVLASSLGNTLISLVRDILSENVGIYSGMILADPALCLAGHADHWCQSAIRCF
jgi:hypothetical protein